VDDDVSPVGPTRVAHHRLSPDDLHRAVGRRGDVREQPLVWVVTPVYNGERYLAECIESVLVQTYENWQYLVVDNCSSDGTAQIVRDYARRDARVRLHQSDEFRPIIANWNRALHLIPSEAKYCKVVHADDTLFPECLEWMVDVAERNPSAAIVTSYRLRGSEVRHEGVPYPVEVVDGHEICRSTLLGSCFVFGSPSSILLRAADVRARSSFYNEQNLHADTEVCFDLLRDADLGFVHQILTRTRVHDEAVTSSAVRINTFHDAWLMIHIKYGEFYLGRREYRSRLVTHLRRYAVFLAKAVIRAKYRDPRFRKHHQVALRRLLESLTSNQPLAGEPATRSRPGKADPRSSSAGKDAVERN
jgi:glycosyltransferase involved in cell wall biosynthesis